MRTLLLACAAALVSSAAFAAGRAATVYTADGQKLMGTVLDESFEIKTSCGTFTVPAGQMRAIWPGFITDGPTSERMEELVTALAGGRREKAAADLEAAGRIAVPHLQDAAAAADARIATSAATLLKTLWPTGEKTPSDDRDILLAHGAELRGTFSFVDVRIEGPLGKAAVRLANIRVIQFDEVEPVPPADLLGYGPVAGKDPELDVAGTDGSQVVGLLDFPWLDVAGPYGKTRVPLKELVSYTPGRPGEVVTRDLTFPADAVDLELVVREKARTCRVPREEIRVLTVRLGAGSARTDLFPSRFLPWREIYSGKGLDGWKPLDKFAPEIASDGSIRCHWDRWKGLSWRGSGPLANVILRTEVRWNKGVGRVGISLHANDRNTDRYFIRLGGVAMYDVFNAAVPSAPKTVIFRMPNIPRGEWHAYEAGVCGKTLRAAVDGVRLGEATLTDELPAGWIAISAEEGFGGDLDFRNIRIKVLR